MYLERITLTNTGPIEALDFELPFSGAGDPVPVFLVGVNGSGKSTAVSYIVNALVGAKAEAFDDAEIKPGKVFRLRSSRFIRHGCQFSHAFLKFSGDVSLEEWQLTQTRKELERQLAEVPTSESWKQIPQDSTSSFKLNPTVRNVIGGSQDAAENLREIYNEGCVLYFPPNRFEEPSWLNELNLRREAEFGRRKNMQGLSERRIFSDTQIAATANWILNLLLDRFLQESVSIPMATTTDGISSEVTHSEVVYDGPNEKLFNAVIQILKVIFSDRGCDHVMISLGSKRNRTVGIELKRNGNTIGVIPDLFSLSSGESALFALFSSILRDYDFGTGSFAELSDVRGIVVIDEVDLHLHLNLQRKVIPKLFALLPGVQFIVTTHSPLLLLGMQEKFGADGFQVRALPAGQPVSAEMFAEFDVAYSSLRATERFQNELRERINVSAKPLLLTEGRSDVLIIREAWKRLRPNLELPFEIMPAGIDPDESVRTGGAEQLRRQLEFLPTTTNRPIVGLFDNDREGNEQFKGLNKTAFESWATDSQLRKHCTGAVWGLLLPVPPDRTKWVTADDISHRYLSIEHYFSDATLRNHSLMGSEILCTEVFEVSKKKKMDFAESLAGLTDAEFSKFELLFDRLVQAPPFAKCGKQP